MKVVQWVVMVNISFKLSRHKKWKLLSLKVMEGWGQDWGQQNTEEALLPLIQSSGFGSQHSEFYSAVAKINRRPFFEESGQRHETTHLVLVSDKLVPQSNDK